MATRRMFLTALAGATAASALGAPRAFAGPLVDPAQAAQRYAGRAPTRWGMSMPGVVSTFPADGRQLALTLDACDGACDDALLATLRRYRVPAVLFVCSKWIDANPGRVERLAASPLLEIGNHGTRHVPLSVTGRRAYGITGTRSAADVVAEVWTNQQRLVGLTGRAPVWFRAATAHYDDVAVQIVRGLGLTPLGFTVNADNGATAPPAAVRSATGRALPGSVVIAHLNHPRSGTAAGLGAAIPAMLDGGWEFVLPPPPGAVARH
ncbi:MAG: polysaccharide deacetylase family protein [Mycobacterium sp.]